MNQFESPKKLDAKIRKSGIPTALKKTPNAPFIDCFLQSFFHIPEFARYVLQYDDSVINEEGITLLLQRLFVQLIYCKRKDTSSADLHNFMMEDYNTRYRNPDEFLVRFVGKLDESISKYQTILNIDSMIQSNPIKDMMVGKMIQEENETDFHLIRLNNVEDLYKAWQHSFHKEKPIYIKKAPQVLTFEVQNCMNMSLKLQIFVDEFLYSNKDSLAQHQAKVSELMEKREVIRKQIKNIENYNSSLMSVSQMLQMSIEIIQQQRNELLDGDPAVEGLLNHIIQSNQNLEQLQQENCNIENEIKSIMVDFNKFKYNLHSIIILDGDYECVYVKNKELWYFFEDGHAEVKKQFDFENGISQNAIVYLMYTQHEMKDEYALIVQSDLLEMDQRQPYSSLVRKDLHQYALKFNSQIEQEFIQLRQQQSAEDVWQIYSQRFNCVAKIVNKRLSIQIPHLTNFASYLVSASKVVDDFVKWQILDCSIKDVNGQSITDIKNMGPFAQKLSMLIQNQPQRAPSMISVSQKDMQIMQLKLLDYVQQVQNARILVYGLQCVFEDKSVQALNSFRAIQEQNSKNTLQVLNQEILKGYMLRLCFNMFQQHQSQQYMEFWDNMQMVITYFVYVSQNDLVYRQIIRMVKDIVKKANKKALNSDQMKIVKRFISAFEDKKAFDSGINLLMKKDAVDNVNMQILESLIQTDWNQDYYYWSMDQKEDITIQLTNQVSLLQQHYSAEFTFQKLVTQQQEVYDYNERLNLKLHCPM